MALDIDSSPTLTPTSPPQEVLLTLSPSAKKSIATAKRNFYSGMAEKESDVLLFEGFGSDAIKSRFKLSPDAVAQMAIQVAGRSVFGSYRATYESTQTRTFSEGRTEVTRVVSER
jgi:carnitine O-acetyltransferase